MGSSVDIGGVVGSTGIVRHEDTSERRGIGRGGSSWGVSLSSDPTLMLIVGIATTMVSRDECLTHLWREWTRCWLGVVSYYIAVA